MKNNVQDDTLINEMLEECRIINDRLFDEFGTNEKQLYLDLAEMFEDVANHIFAKQSDLRKEIGEIMGGRILELESERLLRTGEEKGEEKAKLDIAKKMLERGFSLEDIQFSTGLSKEKLEEI
ncbi:MAG: hypothetical protein ACLTS1_06905 [Coprococcus sp.]